MSKQILLCTVGGSHQPILAAIQSISSRYVCFFCTSKDPDSGRSGSDVQITGSGNVIKANPRDDRPTLPNIPAQARLGEDEYELRIVPADDLDGAYIAIRNAAAELAKRFPDARFVADYTGGTKTMTAALVCAALERDDVELQLVAGARADLVRVADGTEQTVTASVARLRLERAMAPYLSAWSRFAYHEAAEGLGGIRVSADAADRARLELARTLSRALARWDDFDHAGALALIKPYAGRIAQSYPMLLPTLRLLANKDDTRHDPARLFDLWLNAERRASQGRFDDAVARVYRLIEWTAQWQLGRKLNIDTADFPADLLPTDIDAHPDREGKIKLPLWSAWRVAQGRLGEPIQGLIENHGAELRNLLAIRNRSILAHGFIPVQKPDWERMRQWTQERFLPVLRHLAKEAGLKHPLEQLPTEFVG